MIRVLAAISLAGCWTDSARPPTPPPQPPPSPTLDAAPVAGGCNDAHDCQLRSVCGCSCEAVPWSAPAQVACDESCPNKNICDGYTVICELASHRCGAIPKRSP